MKNKLSSILLVLALSFGVTSISDAAPTCTKGKPCGESCIAKDKECHVGAAADTMATKSTPAPTKTMTTAKEPAATKEPTTMAKAPTTAAGETKQCKSGKLCGDTCISKNKTCNK
jgi:hypothetical protein